MSPRATTTTQTSFDEPDAPSADASSSIPVTRFDEAYRARPPWDIDGPQPAFVGLCDAKLVRGRVLDVGCGTGENALLFAARGLAVTGLDASAVAIAQAQGKARDRGLSARFLQGDALRLADLGETFDTVTDSGMLHVFSDPEMEQVIRGVRAVLAPGGTYCLLCFSEHAGAPGPRRLTREDIAALFADGWRIESVEASHFEIIPGRFVDNAAPTAAWLARIRRV